MLPGASFMKRYEGAEEKGLEAMSSNRKIKCRGTHICQATTDASGA